LIEQEGIPPIVFRNHSSGYDPQHPEAPHSIDDHNSPLCIESFVSFPAESSLHKELKPATA
jgi:hypothetical protein